MSQRKFSNPFLNNKDKTVNIPIKVEDAALKIQTHNIQFKPELHNENGQKRLLFMDEFILN